MFRRYTVTVSLLVLWLWQSFPFSRFCLIIRSRTHSIDSRCTSYPSDLLIRECSNNGHLLYELWIGMVLSLQNPFFCKEKIFLMRTESYTYLWVHYLKCIYKLCCFNKLAGNRSIKVIWREEIGEIGQS